MSYLLDTNVLSEVRRPRPDPHVLAWLDAVEEDQLYLSVVTIAELARGITLLPAGRRRNELALWLETDLQSRFGERLLPIDAGAAFAWGRLMADCQKAGHNASVMDGWIAAIARQNGLAVATRNMRDFQMLGVDIFNPWDFGK